MSDKKFKFKAVPLGGSAPTPGSTGNETYTLFAKQLTSTTFTPIVTDGNGKALEMVTSSGGGGTPAPAVTPTLSQVLSAGNTLDGKEISGDLRVVNEELTAAGSKNLEFVIRDNNLEFYSRELTHRENLEFRASLSDLHYESHVENGDTFGLHLADNGYDINIPNKNSGISSSTLNLKFDSLTGLYSSEIFPVTEDGQFIQKKYLDDKLAGLSTGGGEKIDVTVDRMYLTYAGKLAVDITVNGIPGHKVTDPNLFDHSTFRMKVANVGGGNVPAYFTFGPTGNATIEKTYMYSQTGTVKAHIEAVLPNSAVDRWGETNPRKDIFNQTQGFFVYIPEAGMPFNNGVRSRMTHYGEVYDKRQSGVVNFKLQDGKQSTLIPSTEEYKFFAFGADTFKAEGPVDSTYSYLINNGIPIGSQDVQSGYILSDNRIMPNPTPNQVTEWELTFKLGGEDASRITNILDYMVVVYDSENNPLEHVHFDFFNDSAGEVATARAKLTTINKFKNIVGNGRGFKFGIKINRGILDLNYDVKFELVNIKRTSRALV